MSPKTEVHIHNITTHQMIYDDFVVHLSSFWQMKRIDVSSCVNDMMKNTDYIIANNQHKYATDSGVPGLVMVRYWVHYSR